MVKILFFLEYMWSRLGEHISPILFSIYLNALEDVLLSNVDLGITFDCVNEYISIFVKRIVLLYADDTVLSADSAENLQRTIDVFYDYCKKWKLEVNLTKTKVIVVGANKTRNMEFKLGDNIVEISDKYKYLCDYGQRIQMYITADVHWLPVYLHVHTFCLYLNVRKTAPGIKTLPTTLFFLDVILISILYFAA